MGFMYTDGGLLCCDFCGRNKYGGTTRVLRSDKPKRGYHAVIRRGKWTWTVYRASDIQEGDDILYYERRVAFTVRRVGCPYNWCQAWAACTDCRAEGRHLYASCVSSVKGDGQTHRNVCKLRSREFRENEDRKVRFVSAAPGGTSDEVAATVEILQVPKRNRGAV